MRNHPSKSPLQTNQQLYQVSTTSLIYLSSTEKQTKKKKQPVQQPTNPTNHQPSSPTKGKHSDPPTQHPRRGRCIQQTTKISGGKFNSIIPKPGICFGHFLGRGNSFPSQIKPPPKCWGGEFQPLLLGEGLVGWSRWEICSEKSSHCYCCLDLTCFHIGITGTSRQDPAHLG